MRVFATTPKSVNDAVLAIRKKLGINSAPQLIVVAPESGCELGECFINVQRHVRVEGGAIQFGWTLWECPKKYIEAEFHAVWVTPSGSLIDITPHRDGESQILFIPDPNRRYSNKIVPTARLALCSNSDILRFIDHADALDRFKAEHVDSNGRPTYTAREFNDFVRSRPQLRTLGRNTPCPCGSGAKYKKCCGRNSPNY